MNNKNLAKVYINLYHRDSTPPQQLVSVVILRIMTLKGQSMCVILGFTIIAIIN